MRCTHNAGNKKYQVEGSNGADQEEVGRSEAGEGGCRRQSRRSRTGEKGSRKKSRCGEQRKAQGSLVLGVGL